MAEERTRESTGGDGAEGRYRQYPGLSGIFVKALAAGLALFCLLDVGDVFARVGIYFLGTQYGAIFLMVVSILIFLLIPGGKGEPMLLPILAIIST